MFGDTDLAAIFYPQGEGTVELSLVGASPAQTFRAHLGEEDQEVLQGYAVGTVRLLQYPTAAAVLAEGDELTDGANTWRVLSDPQLIVDGAESQTYLVPA